MYNDNLGVLTHVPIHLELDGCRIGNRRPIYGVRYIRASIRNIVRSSSEAWTPIDFCSVVLVVARLLRVVLSSATSLTINFQSLVRIAFCNLKKLWMAVYTRHNAHPYGPRNGLGESSLINWA